MRRPRARPHLRDTLLGALCLAAALAAATAPGATADVRSSAAATVPGPWPFTASAGELRDQQATATARAVAQTVAQACQQAYATSTCSFSAIVNDCHTHGVDTATCTAQATALTDQPPGWLPGPQTPASPAAPATATPAAPADPAAGADTSSDDATTDGSDDEAGGVAGSSSNWLVSNGLISPLCRMGAAWLAGPGSVPGLPPVRWTRVD